MRRLAKPRHLTGFALFGFLSCLVLANGSRVRAEEVHAAPAPALKLTLDQALELSMANQPAIAGAHASAAAVEAQMEAANSLLANLSGPQIHIRRKQADLGVAAAHANVTQAEQETINAVTRNYLSVLYAGEQLKIAQDVAAEFKAIYDVAKRLVGAASKEVTTADLDRIKTYQLLADTRISTARLGLTRGKAALREAIGLPQHQAIEIADDKLANYYDSVTKHFKERGLQVSCPCAIEKALQNRPEVIQAGVFAEIAHLEIEAQGLTLHSYARTFAATADIHAKILPANVINGEYRPGPLGPEYPVYLAGSRSQRQHRAELLYQRAASVSDKARGLIALEVEEACARLIEWGKQVESLQEAVKQTDKLVKDALKAYRNDQLKTEQMLAAQVLDAQTRAQLNEAIYNYAIALATLQRATACHLWSCLEQVPGETPGN